MSEWIKKRHLSFSWFSFYYVKDLCDSSILASLSACKTLSCRFSVISHFSTHKKMCKSSISFSLGLQYILLYNSDQVMSYTRYSRSSSISFRRPLEAGGAVGQGRSGWGRDHWPPESCSGGSGGSCILWGAQIKTNWISLSVQQVCELLRLKACCYRKMSFLFPVWSTKLFSENGITVRSSSTDHMLSWRLSSCNQICRSIMIVRNCWQVVVSHSY